MKEHYGIKITGNSIDEEKPSRPEKQPNKNQKTPRNTPLKEDLIKKEGPVSKWVSKKKIKLFSPTGKYCIGLSYCDEHGYIKTKVRIRKTDDGKYYTVKTRKQISEKEATEIVNRFDKLKEEKHLKKHKKK